MSSARHVALGGVLALCVATVVGAHGRAQSQGAFNFETMKGHITVVGCLGREHFGKGKDEKYVLMRPTIGPVNSVSEATCESGGATFQLEDEKRGKVDPSMVGRWVEITGRLGGVQDSNGLRRLHARDSKLVPVVIPPTTEAPPAARIEPPVMYRPPAAAETPAATPEATGTSGVIEKKLPKTGSELPLTALLGLIALAAGFSLRQFSAKGLLG